VYHLESWIGSIPKEQFIYCFEMFSEHYLGVVLEENCIDVHAGLPRKNKNQKPSTSSGS
jgi:hypothetical protein